MQIRDVNRIHIRPSHLSLMLGHRHDHHELVYCCTPGYAVDTDGQHHEPGRGTACYYPAGHRHSGSLTNPCTIILLQWRENHDGLGRRRLTQDPDGRLLVLLNWVLEEWISAAPKTTEMSLRLLGCITGLLADSPAAGFGLRMDTPIRRMMRTIRDTFAANLSLDDLARIAGLSKWNLVRECKAQLGDTPGAILRRTRLHAARNLLADGQDLGAVVRSVGYTSTRSLAKALRIEFGRSVAELQQIPLAHEMELGKGRDSWWR